MKEFFRVYLIAVFLVTNIVSSQESSCPNSDFESGTFSGWQGGTGFCCPINIANSGIVPGRHTIMSGKGTDPNTCGNITVVAPGGLYSARLGNDNTGTEAEKLTYSVNVTASNTLFIYKYAVVLQDPGHSPNEQPRFQIRVLNAAGSLIDPVCGEYTVVSGSNIPGFQTCNGGVIYKDWTSVGLDLSSYIGQTITIEFATGDCSKGGHYGYAYVDAYCSPLKISSTYCTGSFKAVLSAPIGFSYLWNTGETTQSISVNDPNAGLTYTCLLTSVTGCTVNISTVLTLFDPVADFNITNTCYNNAVFKNTTSLPFGTILDTFLWDFGDGTTSTIENPAHTFSTPGDYNVTFTISNALGCKSTTTKSVKVYQEPTANIAYTTNTFCNSLTNAQPVNLTGTNLYTGGFFSAPAGLNINAVTGAIIPDKSIPGNYVVTYTIPTSNGCTVPPATTDVAITLLPTAFISYPNLPYCGNITSPQSVSLNGTGAYKGGTFSSTLGLTIDGKTGAVTPSSSATGNYVVTYNVPAIGGCGGFSVTTNVVVNSFPTAAISYSGAPFCTSLNTLQAVTLTGTYAYTGGVFSAPTGLSIDPVTGKINPGTSKPGTYTVTYVIPAIVNCNLAPVTTKVTVTGLPSAVISYNSPFCRDVSTPQPVNLTGTLAFTGGTFTSTAGLVIDNSTGAISPKASKAGTYLITYTIPASTGCPAIPVTTSVIINPLPEPNLIDGDICLDSLGNLARSFTFESGLTNRDFTFQWFFNGAIITGALQGTYTATEIGDYSVIATNIVTGCVSNQVFATVISAQMADDFIMSVSDTFTENNVLTVVVNGGTGPFFFQLDNESFQESNVFHQLSSGVHIVSIKDDTNCTVISKQVTIMGYPKFFTPNSDGFNDYWNISNFNDFPQAQIQIFDRFGKMIKVLSPLGSGWDGTYDGNLLPAADYWFIVNFKELNQNGDLESKTFKSHFSLKR